ncbi:hypothetical protein ACFWFU_22645 [Streptomyces sp. NPDC060235]|uniref:hypothetical protein n=1 Tax=Streptomyces sp. NPDC060235 TaxID=3347080 RepID=UPI00366A5143
MTRGNGIYPPPRSPRLLLLTALLVAVTGIIALTLPSDSVPSPLAALPTRPPAAAAPPSSPLSPRPNSASASRHISGASSPAPTQLPEPTGTTALPPHGGGPAGDRAVQHALETAWPADLSPVDEQRLRVLGASLLRADATGVGRSRWPRLFDSAEQAIAPAFATARFRVQAVIARRDGPAGRAVVHLVWAGADRGGSFTDGRITDLQFVRSVTKGGARWSPKP